MMVNEEAKRFMRLVFSHIVQSVKPGKLIQSQLKLDENKLHINANSYDLKGNCYIVGFGKAVYEMACEVYDILGSNHIRKGILSIPVDSIRTHNHLNLNKQVFKVFEGARNNIPDENSYKAAHEILELVKPLNANDTLFVMISGGGSALLTYPAPPLSLQEKISVTKLLSQAGANINELNTVRKQLSAVKGGRLAEAAYPCQIISLILSDVINDPLDIIASGPTVPNEDLPGTGLKVLEKFNLLNKVSKNILNTLRNFENNPNIELFKKSHIHIIGNNTIALASGKSFIESEGKVCHVLTNQLQGNVINVSHALGQLTTLVCKLIQNKVDKSDFIEGVKALPILEISEAAIENLAASLTSLDEIYLLLGGETTVNVTGKGKGGRNMELALRYSENLSNVNEKGDLKDFEITFLSAGTDGIDGVTDSAGAISYKSQMTMAKKQGLNIEKTLAENDSYNFFKDLNEGEDIITIGHTGTNVMDVMILHILNKKE